MHRRPEVIFFVLALVFGLANIYYLPPFQSPDESNHFHRTAHITQGYMMGFEEDQRLGGMLEKEYLDYSLCFDRIRKSDNNSFNQKDFVNAKRLDDKDKIFVDFANVGYYSPSVYFPQVIGLWISKIFRVSVFHQLYVGRFAGYLFWLIVVFWSIKLIPTQKYLWVFLALLPASISINSSLSGDVVSNALAFFAIAWSLSKMQKNEGISILESLIVTLCLSVIAINKPVYFPLVFMLVLISKQQFVRPLFKWLMILLPVALMLIWIPYSHDLFIPFDLYNSDYRLNQQLNPGVNPAQQLEFILSNPFYFAKIALLSYLDSAPATWAHYIGKFGWEKNYISSQMIALLSFMLLALTFVKEQGVHIRQKKKWKLAVIALLMLGAFTVSIYMQWSPVGNEQVWSLSGRYFIPIFPLLFLAAPSFKWDKRVVIERISIVLIALANMSLIYEIIQRYY